MTRGKKLLYLALALALACGAVFSVRFIPDPEAEDTEDGELIFSLDQESVSALTVDCGDELRFEKTEEGWLLAEDASFPLDQGYIQTMLDSLSGIRALKTLDEPGEIDQYGLEDGACVINVSAGDDTEIRIGELNPSGEQRYLSTGDGKVYLVGEDIIDSFSHSLYDMVEKEDIPAMSQISSFNVQSGGKSYTLKYIEDSGLCYSDEYVWFYKDGEEYLNLDTSLTDSFTRKISGLSWGACVEHQAGEDSLAQYGLDEPRITVSLEYTRSVRTETDMTDSDGQPIYSTEDIPGSFVLEIGGYSGSSCYARIAGSSMVYLIDGELCDSLLDISYEDLAPDEILLMDWSSVDRAEIYAGELSLEADRDSGSSEDSLSWSIDGESAALQELLDQLGSLIPSGSVSGQSPEGEAALRFVFHRSSASFSTVELGFYRYNSGSYLVCLDGTCRLLAAAEDVDSLIQSLQALV